MSISSVRCFEKRQQCILWLELCDLNMLNRCIQLKGIICTQLIMN